MDAPTPQLSFKWEQNEDEEESTDFFKEVSRLESMQDREWDVSGRLDLDDISATNSQNKNSSQTPLLSVRESNALSSFFNNILGDPGFIFEPKVPTYPSSASGSASIDYEQDSYSTMETSDLSLAQSTPVKPELSAQDTSIDNHSTADHSDSSMESPAYKRKRKRHLSDKERKLNHVTSERNRRDLIKYYFQEVSSRVQPVPGKKTRQSKKAILIGVRQHLDYLANENQALKRFVEQHEI